jgi:hypothetical protein
VLAHAGAADESLSVVLLFAALWLGWAGWSRLKGRGFPRLPAWAGRGLLAVATVFAIATAVVPRALFPPTPAGTRASTVSPGARPSSTATLSFDEPVNGEVVREDQVEIVLELQGGRIVEGASSTLTPDTGHVHLVLDGALVSMTYGLVQVVALSGVEPGSHTLQAEYVAADHAPFDPRVISIVRFRTEGR